MPSRALPISRHRSAERACRLRRTHGKHAPAGKPARPDRPGWCGPNNRGSCRTPTTRCHLPRGADGSAAERVEGPHLKGSHGTDEATRTTRAAAEAARPVWSCTSADARPCRYLARLVQDGRVAGDPVGCPGRCPLHLRPVRVGLRKRRSGRGPYQATSGQPRPVLRPDQRPVHVRHLPQPGQAARGARGRLSRRLIQRVASTRPRNRRGSTRKTRKGGVGRKSGGHSGPDPRPPQSEVFF